jgi:ATP dependent DNA ligase-like protein
MARRDSVGIRLITRRGNDWSDRFPLVVEAVNHLKVRSCLIDGEVCCCDERGLARFDVLRRRRNEVEAFLFAFDLLELDGTDLGASRSRSARRPWPASCEEPFRRPPQRAPGARLRPDGFPARLPARLRGHRVQTTGIALPIWAFARLAEVQVSGCAGGEA